MIQHCFGAFMAIVEGQREAGDNWEIYLHAGEFMSIVQGQTEAGDIGNDTT